ncbi:MAG: hypothetical protein ACRCUY_10940 [Thermoguttaceae bacterium]
MSSKTDIADMIPKGSAFYWFLLVIGGAFIASLELAYSQLPSWTERYQLPKITALDVMAPESLLNWFLSTLLLLAASIAFVNYQLAKQYNDSWGKKTAWLFGMGAFVFLSMESYVSLHKPLRELFVRMTGTPLYGDGSIWCFAVYIFVFGVIATRIWVDLTRCIVALILFSCAMIATVAALLFQLVPELHEHLSLKPNEFIILQTTLPVSAALISVIALGLFARKQVLRNIPVLLNSQDRSASMIKPSAFPAQPFAPRIQFSSNEQQHTNRSQELMPHHQLFPTQKITPFLHEWERPESSHELKNTSPNYYAPIPPHHTAIIPKNPLLDSEIDGRPFLHKHSLNNDIYSQ